MIVIINGQPRIVTSSRTGFNTFAGVSRTEKSGASHPFVRKKYSQRNNGYADKMGLSMNGCNLKYD